MHWFGEDFRKILMLYVSPAWAKEQGAHFDAEALVAAHEAAHTRCIQPFCKDHHGYCYYRCSLGRPYPVDVLGELIAAARPRGIHIIPYFSVGYDAYATGMNPEWLHVNADGRPVSTATGPFQWACLNSPYRHYCLQQIAELVDNYEVDGLWLDILPLRPATVALDGRPGLAYLPDAPCYCPTCQALYRQRYGCDLPLLPSQADRVRTFQMRVDGARSFVQEVARLVKARRPDAIVTYNGSGKPVDAIACADLNSVEAHAPDYMSTSFYAMWGRHSGLPTELYTPLSLPGSGLGFNGWDVKPAEILELESAIALAHGAVLWLAQNTYPDGSTDQAQYDLFTRIFAFVESMEPYVQGSTPVSDVALVMTNRPYSAPAHGHESVLATQALHQALVHGHCQFDIVRLPADLSPYRLVILGEQSVMSEADAEVLRRYVHDGGCLFATGATSLYDEAGARRGNFALADVLGVDFVRHSQQPYVYLRLADEQIATRIPQVPILVQMPSLEVTVTSGETLAHAEYPEVKRTDILTILWGYPPPDAQQRHPAIVLNRFGRGTCIYSAVGFPNRANDWAKIMTQRRETTPSATGNALDVIWTERLARNIVCRLLPDPLLETDAPPGVEVRLNHWRGRYLVHLMNHYAGDPANPCYGGDRLVLRNIVLRLNTARLGPLTWARLLPKGEAIETRVLGTCTEVVIPELAIHGLVQLGR